MNTKLLTVAASAATMMIATPAFAQDADAPETEVYVGASIGYHDIGVGLPGDDGAIYGVVAGVDAPVGETLFVGAEANFHLGDGVIDSEYGVAARAGIQAGNSKFYVKGGYQEVNFDLVSIAGPGVPAGTDDTDGDYLVGIGADIGLSGDNVRLRLNADTIAFDSTRLTAGVLFAF